MMKFTGALTTGLATLFVLPAVTQEDGRGASLEAALKDTVHALEVLAGLEEELASGDRPAVETILAWTEPPAAPPEELDELLAQRRDEVSLLRLRVDDAMAGGSGTLAGSTPLPPGMTGRPNTGLDPLLVQTLGTIPAPDRAAEPEVPKSQPVATEPEGYTADPLGQAQACYRAQRYEEGLALLKEPAADPQAWYWRGRLLERLERHDEATRAYEKVIELAPDGYEAERARSNLDFLKWKLEFLDKVPGPSGTASPPASPQSPQRTGGTRR